MTTTFTKIQEYSISKRYVSPNSRLMQTKFPIKRPMQNETIKRIQPNSFIKLDCLFGYIMPG